MRILCRLFGHLPVTVTYTSAVDVSSACGDNALNLTLTPGRQVTRKICWRCGSMVAK